MRNNSIYVGNGSGSTAIAVDDMGDDHIVVSNAIHYAGAGSFNCFRAGLPPSAYDAFDHNVCYTPNAPGAEWVDGSGSLAAWQSATGFDGSSSTADPGFTNPAAGELWAAGELATMVGFGDPALSSPNDIDGFPRDSEPDAGAYELGIGLIFADGFESGDTSAWSATVSAAKSPVVR